jgi:ribonuclease HI
MINVYTDGSCINNGLPDAISGYGVYFSENDLRNESKKIEGKKHTNNIAELTGFIRALEILNEEIIKGTHINVYTDSEYVIKCASNYGEKLERNNWKNTNKQDIHSIGNEMADKLANEAIGINSCPYNDKKKFINISFGNKDMAKELGAKWDKNKKSWYYDDKISEENINKLKDLESNNSNCIRTDVSNDKKNYIKISFAKKNLAKSYGAKWDPITKSWYYLDNLDSEKITKLKELKN